MIHLLRVTCKPASSTKRGLVSVATPNVANTVRRNATRFFSFASGLKRQNHIQYAVTLTGALVPTMRSWPISECPESEQITGG